MKYISILRGINVGGFKKIKMDDLRALYELSGFGKVVTYIQSGNVIFETEIKNKNVLKGKIERAIERKYGFFVPVEIRTNREIKSIIKNCPFGSIDPVEEGTKVSVTFLSSKPSEVKVFEIQKHIFTPDKLVIKGEEAYLYCPNGYGKSKLSNAFLEKKLGVSATTRNWKSVHKLYELSLQ
ncbi:MAG: DUF1697 domain-containing protein [Candidatus Aminicenantes bacterium]|nr:DUF1697 domain-containing protein [Candidatus Aminicenantes bacterium]